MDMQVEQKRRAGVATEQEVYAKKHGERLGDIQARKAELAERAKKAKEQQSKVNHEKGAAALSRDDLIAKLKLDVAVIPVSDLATNMVVSVRAQGRLERDKANLQQDIEKARSDVMVDIDHVRQLMGTPESKAIQQPFNNEGRDIGQVLGLNELHGANELEHEMMIDEVDAIIKGVNNVMADVLIPGFEQEVRLTL